MVSYESILKAQEKGWIKSTSPIEAGGYKFIPWKITDDSLYDSSNKDLTEWLLDNVPRSLVTIHDLNSGNFIRAIYGLKKFGSVDESTMGSNIRIAKLLDTGIPVSIKVHQKHNGEAGFLSGFEAIDGFYYIVASKSVPAVIKSREELDLLDPYRFKTCKQIGTQLFDLIDKMDLKAIKELQTILSSHILPIEKIDREFKHIACEPPGLYILGVRDGFSLRLLTDPEPIVSQMVVWGFFQAKKFTDDEIAQRVQTVKESLGVLPTTSDKPTLDQFDKYMEPKNFLKIWSYVSLVYEQVICPQITWEEILSIGSGQPQICTNFNLIEGTIISVQDLTSGEIYMIKDKDLLYYLLRGVRTIVESYKTRPYTGKPIRSRSLDHWFKYLSIPWAQAWKEFIGIVQKYMGTYDCVQAIKSNCAKHGMGGIDAPDFFSSLSVWLKSNPKTSNFRPIFIISTEVEACDLKDLTTGPEFEFSSKVPSLEQIPNGIVGLIYGVKISSLVKLNSEVSFVKYTKMDLNEKFDFDKKTKVFIKDLLLDKQTHEYPLYKTKDTLVLAINELIKSSSQDSEINSEIKHQGYFENQRQAVFKVDYFDSNYMPSQSDIPGFIKLMNLATQINLSGKFENSITPEQRELKSVKWTELVPRNTKLTDQILENILGLVKNGTNTKLAIFITGLPGLGKDWVGSQIQTRLEAALPELINKIQVINQDMFGCDATKYAQGLSKVVQTKSIIFITRNGPGSARSLEICKGAGFTIHLIAPRDPQMLLLAGCIQHSLVRAHEDLKKTHVLSSLPDEKIISIGSNFFGALGSANTSIVSSGLPTKSKQPRFIGIELDHESNTNSGHVTIEHGIITCDKLLGPSLGQEIIIKTIKRVCVKSQGYGLEFEICELPAHISELVESRVPHITCKTSGYAKPVHSGWWGWIVEKLDTKKFGPWDITVESCDKVYIGTIKLFY